MVRFNFAGNTISALVNYPTTYWTTAFSITFSILWNSAQRNRMHRSDLKPSLNSRFQLSYYWCSIGDNISTMNYYWKREFAFSMINGHQWSKLHIKKQNDGSSRSWTAIHIHAIIWRSLDLCKTLREAISHLDIRQAAFRSSVFLQIDRLSSGWRSLGIS